MAVGCLTFNLKKNFIKKIIEKVPSALSYQYENQI
tara:strand:- start:668 stop:772 length:105 start_codon:yes stop_codon:yes gene_type:complete